MNLNPVNRSPTEEGELEDGEICDDETEESLPIQRGDGNRPGRGGRPRKPHPHPHNMLPHMGHQPPDFHLIMPYNRPHGHSAFLPSHRQQCGPSGPDRPPAPTPQPLLPLPPPPLALPGLGPHGELSPRTSGFWERSHSALGRFRHRVMPNGGRGNWNRGNRGGGGTRGPPGRHGPGENHLKKDSPLRKRILLTLFHHIIKWDKPVNWSPQRSSSFYRSQSVRPGVPTGPSHT